ncbi:unnamed protein product, partial [Discosporangium mesarthrocarpum]
FSLLLPVTSRTVGGECGTCTQREAEDLIRAISRAIVSTTEREERGRVKLFVGIDEGDPVYDTTNGREMFTEIFRKEAGVAIAIRSYLLEKKEPLTTPKRSDYTTGQVCRVWRELARWAWDDGVDYTVLIGDDVQLLTQGWMGLLCNGFQSLHREAFPGGCSQIPVGFGLLSLSEIGSPSFPGFPCLHKVHLEIFPEVFPKEFVNQDADPYLYQVYLRFAAAKVMRNIQVANTIGGCEGEPGQEQSQPRYFKAPLQGWKDEQLPAGVEAVSRWLEGRLSGSFVLPRRRVVLDVVVPSFRVDVNVLLKICTLDVPSEMRCTFIVIFDNPDILDDDNEASKAELARRARTLEEVTWERKRNSCRVRINQRNLGASLSRNKGIEESCADFVLLLDDDICPAENLLHVYCREILRVLEKEDQGGTDYCCGFVGLTEFPLPTTLMQRAVILSDLTYMYHVSNNVVDPAWGVTANIVFRMDQRRGRRSALRFGEEFPKTGGGEDVDMCLRYQQNTGGTFLGVKDAVVTHHWWPGTGLEYPRHFFRWSTGDGALPEHYPQYKYHACLNVTEMILVIFSLHLLLPLVVAVLRLGTDESLTKVDWMALPIFLMPFLASSAKTAAAVLAAEISFDICRHAWTEWWGPQERRRLPMSLKPSPPALVLAAAISSLLITILEAGRIWGRIKRRGVFFAATRFGTRFEWFCGRMKGAKETEISIARMKFSFYVCAIALS